MTSSPGLEGSVRQRLEQGGFGVTVREPGFFLVDHNYPPGGEPVPVPLLMTILDAPLAIRVDGSGPRGFIAELKAGQDRIASANTFDPAGLNPKGQAVIDRWEDTGHALVATTEGKAWEDLRRTVQFLTLVVRKLLMVKAGGLVWRHDGPVTPLESFNILARRMNAYAPPSTILKNVQSNEIGAIIKAMEDLETTDKELERLGIHVPRYTVETGLEPGSFDKWGALGLLQMAGAVKEEHKGGGAFLGRGEQLPHSTGIAIEPVDPGGGGEQRFDLLLFGCNSPDALEAFRNVRSRP